MRKHGTVSCLRALETLEMRKHGTDRYCRMLARAMEISASIGRQGTAVCSRVDVGLAALLHAPPISGAPTPNSPTGRGGRHLTADQRSGVSSVQSALNYIHCQACGHYVHMPSRRHRHHQRIPCARGYGRTEQIYEASPGLKAAPVRPRAERGQAGPALTANRTAWKYVCTHQHERKDERRG